MTELNCRRGSEDFKRLHNLYKRGRAILLAARDEHLRLHGRIVPFAGWELPVQYDDRALWRQDDQ